MNIFKIFRIELFLGISLATAFLTNLRLISVLGLSEIILIICLTVLFLKYFSSIIFNTYPNDKVFFVKLYLSLAIIIILPLNTFSSAINEINRIFPEDIFIFILNLLLLLTIIEAYKDKLNLKFISQTFVSLFIVSVIFAFILLPTKLSYYGGIRFTGGANDPNQICIYVIFAIYFSSMYFRNYFLLLFIPLCFLGVITKSDAFDLSYYIGIGVFFFLHLFYIKSLSFYVNFAIYLAITLIIFFIYLPYENLILYIYDFISSGDGPGSRNKLIDNSLAVIASSPIVGYGAGAFSGGVPFGEKEAHNTILDLSMIFGVLVPSILYFLKYKYIKLLIQSQHYLLASTTIMIVIFSLFHFIGRHPIYWVFIAIILITLNNKKKVIL